MVKTEYYENRQVVFREGDPTTKVFFVSIGEVDIYSKFGDKEITIDSLYQGCWIGAYKVLTGDKHSFTMRAKTDTTLNYISKDDFSILQNGYFDLGKAISETINLMEKSEDPIVDFFCYKPLTEPSCMRTYFKLKIVKIISWIRKLKELNEAGTDMTIQEFLKRLTVKGSSGTQGQFKKRKTTEFENRTNLMMEKILTRIDDMQSLMTTHGKGILEIKSEIRSQFHSEISRCEEDKQPPEEYRKPRERKLSHEPPLSKNKSRFSSKGPDLSREESKDDHPSTENEKVDDSLTAKFGKNSNGSGRIVSFGPKHASKDPDEETKSYFDKRTPSLDLKNSEKTKPLHKGEEEAEPEVNVNLFTRVVEEEEGSLSSEESAREES
uniref:Cyclic nucleotide-binding domain-containing protein n=1 Tax=Euplotes crassus TaxID=5936 RepID=A0A7S3KAY4_EUPCR|mmetsp:Transcript_14134/g.14137  ORF Transcript_14134/g.14137 Transcript_14134/m.14137 type:complete len:380 (+) Transcript_14134:312-1451(+)